MSRPGPWSSAHSSALPGMWQGHCRRLLCLHKYITHEWLDGQVMPQLNAFWWSAFESSRKTLVWFPSVSGARWPCMPHCAELLDIPLDWSPLKKEHGVLFSASREPARAWHWWRFTCQMDGWHTKQKCSRSEFNNLSGKYPEKNSSSAVKLHNTWELKLHSLSLPVF